MSLNWLEHVPTISTTAYAANDIVGTPLAIPAQRSGSPFYIDQIQIIDMDQAKAALRFLFFATQVTVQADNVAMAISDIEVRSHLCGVLASGAYIDVGTSYSTQHIIPARPLVVTPYNGRNIWMVVQTTGTPTYSAVDSLKFRVCYNYQQFGMMVAG